MKNFFLLLILSVFITPCFSQKKQDIFFFTEPMPAFPGGEEALEKYIYDNLVYPQSALNNNIKGKVVIQFAIAPNGDVVNIRIKESLDTACDSTVLDLVKKMPKWIPVRKDTISDDFTLPISFRLPEKQNIDKTRDYEIMPNYDVMPCFPGGQKEMYKFIKEHFIYPQSALDKGIEGRTVIRFLVRKTGYLDSIKVVKSLHFECDSIAMDIIKKMPKWIPGGFAGYQGKKDIWFTLPIVFCMPKSHLINKEIIYEQPDSIAHFPGGEAKMHQYLREKTKYPMDGGYYDQGRVTIRFIVTAKGKIKKPIVLKRMNKYNDKTAINAVLSMPDWIPAKHNGESVNSYFTLPIVFRLNN